MPNAPVEAGAARPESQRDAIKAIESVTGAMAGKEMTEADMKRLIKDLRDDPEAQSAIRVISGQTESAVTARYCPITGRHYSPRVLVCPIHGVDLIPIRD
jgi:hypothetical protein